ncbi:hypothetical protein diail_3352 [Diaporthe ilicicola]|nr:hypothetical protein diail_3352 [Diaporthe ilicicola]
MVMRNISVVKGFGLISIILFENPVGKDTMFRKFRKSVREDKASPQNTQGSHHVCHECGHSLTDTIDTSYADQVIARRYESNRARKRDSWNGSSSSDSGYGSSSSRHSDIRLELSDDHSSTTTPLPVRRPTYNSSIYSEASTFEQSSLHQVMVDPPQVGAPTYDHLFDLPPRTFTNYSEKWKPKSRYARLNELPAASPRALAFPDDVMDLHTDVEPVPAPTEKKRMSLSLRPSSLRRFSARRSKSQ